MYKGSKSEISKNFGPLIDHGPHWINFIILTFLSEKNKYSRCLYKIWSKLISFDMEKKEKSKNNDNLWKKGEFEGSKSEHLCLKEVPQPCLDLIIKS
jgi:hypothetical protein